jgi:pimeloyl-ACP methyl ester carboxylesterase
VLKLTVRSARALEPVAPAVAATPIGRTLLFGHVTARPWRISAPEAVGAVRSLAGSQAFDQTLEVLTRGYFSDGSAIQAPTTVAWGQRDRLLLPRQSRRAGRAIPRARILMLEGCGHVPTWDDPEQVARVLLEGSAR